MAGRRFIVIGAGGHSKVVIATIEAAGDMVLGLLDDNAARHGELVLGRPILGPVTTALIPADAVVVLAIGANLNRKHAAERLPVPYASVVHPTAVVHPSVSIGEGTVIFAGAVVQPDTTIGAHVIVNTAASIDHDNRIGAFAHIAPGAHLSGTVTVGDGALIGIGSAIIPGMTIGAWSTVGGGSAVVRDVPGSTVVGGTPAKELRNRRG